MRQLLDLGGIQHSPFLMVESFGHFPVFSLHKLHVGLHDALLELGLRDGEDLKFRLTGSLRKKLHIVAAYSHHGSVGILKLTEQRVQLVGRHFHYILAELFNRESNAALRVTRWEPAHKAPLAGTACHALCGSQRTRPAEAASGDPFPAPINHGMRPPGHDIFATAALGLFLPIEQSGIISGLSHERQLEHFAPYGRRNSV